jgi:hypothetical protein
MKLKQTTIRKPIIIATIVAAVIVASSSYYVFAMNGSIFGWKLHKDTSGDSSINLSPATDEEKQAGSDVKQQTADPGKPDVSSDPTGNDTAGTDLPITFTAVNQNGAKLQVRAEIQALVSNGTCTLTLTKGGATVTKNAPTQATASVSTCQGFDVATSELSPGTWTLTLNVSADGKTGQASTTTNVE